jgi:hypothetical protein
VFESTEPEVQQGPVPDPPSTSPTVCCKTTQSLSHATIVPSAAAWLTRTTQKSTEVLISPEELDTDALDVPNARAAFKGKLLYANTNTGRALLCTRHAALASTDRTYTHHKHAFSHRGDRLFRVARGRVGGLHQPRCKLRA